MRYENGAIGQFEVSWAFRGGMDLRDEVAGTQGTIWLNHWLRTGTEMFTSGEQTGYIAEKAESAAGWLFPVGDEVSALGYIDMFDDILGAMESKTTPRETFYDGYVVNAIMDAAYDSIRTKQWQPVRLEQWRGREESASEVAAREYDAEHELIKEERMPDGSTKRILRHKITGVVMQRVAK